MVLEYLDVTVGTELFLEGGGEAAPIVRAVRNKQIETSERIANRGAKHGQAGRVGATLPHALDHWQHQPPERLALGVPLEQQTDNTAHPPRSFSRSIELEVALDFPVRDVTVIFDPLHALQLDELTNEVRAE